MSKLIAIGQFRGSWDGSVKDGFMSMYDDGNRKMYNIGLGQNHIDRYTSKGDSINQAKRMKREQFWTGAIIEITYE
jgi:hypothetical protein